MIRVSTRLLAGGLLLGCTWASSVLQVQAAAPSPKTFNLRLSDLPAGFKQTSGRFQSMLEVGSGGPSAAQLQQHGYVSSYIAQFDAGKKTTAQLVYGITFLFRSASGAHWYGQYAATHHNAGSKFTVVSAPHIGQDSFAFATGGGSGRASTAFFGMGLREGARYAGIVVAGPAAITHLSRVEGLARTLDARMKSGG